MSSRRTNALPGLGITLGYSIFYLSLIVLIPLSTTFVKTASLGWAEFWDIISSARAVASYKLTFLAAIVASIINGVFGFVVAWSIVRYEFPGKRIVDALVDLPFALPTAVAGIALTTIYAPTGWIGHLLAPLGIQVAFTPAGIVLALVFVGLPFVVRTVQPVLEDLDHDVEEAAASLGATRRQTIQRVVLPSVAPALMTGVAMSFARAIGEFGSVVFISGNLPMKTEITPLLILTQLEQYNYAAATSLAVVMLVASFVMLFLINCLQAWAERR